MISTLHKESINQTRILCQLLGLYNGSTKWLKLITNKRRTSYTTQVDRKANQTEINDQFR